VAALIAIRVKRPDLADEVAVRIRADAAHTLKPRAEVALRHLDEEKLYPRVEAGPSLTGLRIRTHPQPHDRGCTCAQ
jgi:hypothetical protein